MKVTLKKILSFVLALCVMISTLSVSFTAFAAESTEGVTVEIVSFMRGAQKDLRSSELLEARLTGYEGNPRELTYKWENTLGTYLYVYNSHNMYYIEGTDGEIEIYNDSIAASNNMAGRSRKDSFTDTGYCWAAIYGSNTSGTSQSISDAKAYNGMIKVTVYDKDGKEIASDTHEGKVTTTGFWLWQETTYSGIVDHDLQSDMDHVTIGLFEGDERNVKDLLGESAILHITCVESNVANGKIVSGGPNDGNHIKLEKKSDGDYYITGVTAGTATNANGDAKVELNIQKGFCKFHEDSSGTAVTTVYVFKKPTTSTTAYTLTLTGNLDDRCDYFIYGQQGKKIDGKIVFEGLNPNTSYPVEVRGKYQDESGQTHYAYAYVYDTTKPVYSGTVKTYLDGTYNSETHTATGTVVDISDVTEYIHLYAKEVNSTDDFINLPLTNKGEGTYTNILDTGLYNIYYGTENGTDESKKVDDQILTMHQADRTRYIFYNSVTYKNLGVEFNKEYHLTGSTVNTIKDTPVREDYVFTGWKDENGKIYKSFDEITQSISEPYVLEAQWEKGTDVYVNITLNHKAADGSSINNDRGMHDVVYDLMSKLAKSNNYEDVLTKNIEWDGMGAFSVEGYTADYSDNKTIYTATEAVANNVLANSDYTVEIAKTGYDLISVTTETDENGNIIVDAQLQFAPSSHDFKFSVELDEDSKDLPKEVLPVAVHTKVTCWYDSPYVEGESVDWTAITQHQNTFVTVTLDENGYGEGSYPVWASTTDGVNYHYRIEVVSYLLPDGTVLPAIDGALKENPHVTEKYTEYCTDNERYHAKIVVTDGLSPNVTETKLTGAYFNNHVQQGQVKAVVSVRTHTVTFEPDGGKFADGKTDNKVVEKQIVIPNLSDYAVTKDGGYTFGGWYVVENGEITDKTVRSGDELFGDITLRAVWKAPLKVEGNISVAGYYHLNDNGNEVRVIHKSDRAHEVTIYLQKFLPNGYTETIDSQKIEIAYNDENDSSIEKPIGEGAYQFTGVPDDGTQYRVLIQNPNYASTYQHEGESLDKELMYDYDTYNEHDFVAEFEYGDQSVANVNTFMEFVPTNFTLHYAINAEKIGEGFRPSASKILVTYNDGAHGQHAQDWPVISQMITDTDAYKVDDTAIVDGKGSDSYDVWRTMFDGQTLYDYGVELYKYTINGEETELNLNEAPFFVYYNGSARYSALEGLIPEHQTQLLTIDLQPKRYNVNFDMNYTETEEDHVENMEDYLVFVNGVPKYLKGHIWSYATDISEVKPEREGYKFLGWYDEKDNVVTEIGAEVHENVTVYAKWKKIIKVTFHANNENISDDVFRTYYENGVEVDDENAFFLNADGSLDSFYDIPEFEYYTHNNYVFKGWYDEDGKAITWNEKYTEDTDLYAQWIEVEDVEKDANDGKIYDNSGRYAGFDLLGVQIRTAEVDNVLHHGKEGSGLRFVTVLSNDVYNQINDLNAKNANGAEYGYALAKTATAQKNAGDKEGYEFQYNGTNVNGKDTTKEYSYVRNVKCSGVVDHFGDDETAYRLFTAVVTYKGLSGDNLASAQSQALLARSYIRYTDANGLLRTHYNNYTGNNVYSGCSASYALALSLLNNG